MRRFASICGEEVRATWTGSDVLQKAVTTFLGSLLF